MRSLLAISFNQLGIPSGDSFYLTGNTRSHLATSKQRNTRSLLAISFSQLGIPSGDSFCSMKNEVPSGDLQIVKHEIPSGDLLQSTWNPIWRFLLFNEKRGPIWRPPNSETRDPFWRSPLTWNPIWRFLLLTNMKKNEVPSGDLQIAKHEIPSGDLLQLRIPSGDSFYSNEIRCRSS